MDEDELLTELFPDLDAEGCSANLNLSLFDLKNSPQPMERSDSSASVSSINSTVSTVCAADDRSESPRSELFALSSGTASRSPVYVQAFCPFDGTLVTIEFPREDSGWIFNGKGGNSQLRWDYKDKLVLLVRHSTCDNAIVPRKVWCRNCIMKKTWRRSCESPCNTFFLRAGTSRVDECFALVKELVVTVVVLTDLERQAYYNVAPNVTPRKRKPSLEMSSSQAGSQASIDAQKEKFFKQIVHTQHTLATRRHMNNEIFVNLINDALSVQSSSVDDGLSAEEFGAMIYVDAPDKGAGPSEPDCAPAICGVVDDQPIPASDDCVPKDPAPPSGEAAASNGDLASSSIEAPLCVFDSLSKRVVASRSAHLDLIRMLLDFGCLTKQSAPCLRTVGQFLERHKLPVDVGAAVEHTRVTLQPGAPPVPVLLLIKPILLCWLRRVQYAAQSSATATVSIGYLVPSCMSVFLDMRDQPVLPSVVNCTPHSIVSNHDSALRRCHPQTRPIMVAVLHSLGDEISFRGAAMLPLMIHS